MKSIHFSIKHIMPLYLALYFSPSGGHPGAPLRPAVVLAPGEGARADRGQQEEGPHPQGQAAQARPGGPPEAVAVHRVVSLFQH